MLRDFVLKLLMCLSYSVENMRVCLWRAVLYVMLYLQHILGQGLREGSSPQWDCQLSHETCSVTDCQTKQTDDTYSGQTRQTSWSTASCAPPYQSMAAAKQFAVTTVTGWQKLKTWHHTETWNTQNSQCVRQNGGGKNKQHWPSTSRLLTAWTVFSWNQDCFLISWYL